MRIPLFDIDHTLLVGGNTAHEAAFQHALTTVYNLPHASKAELRTDGMIDTQILLEVIMRHGISEEEGRAKMDEATGAMADYYKAHADEGTCVPLPGVVAILRRLEKEGVPSGLLTGNVESIGWGKMERAGLRNYFSFGAFGNLAFRRADLIPVAHTRAEKALGRAFPVTDLFIVGDSPRDIACAQDGGIPVIAVATGAASTDELAAAGADLVLPSLEDQAAFFAFLQGERSTRSET